MAARSKLSTLPITVLQAEIERRKRLLPELLAMRAQIDAKIVELGGLVDQPTPAAEPKAPAQKPGRKAKRVKNTMNLSDALVAVFAGKQLGVSEAAAAVQAAGYRTKSKIFNTIVNQTLLKDPQFQKVERGVYALKAAGKVEEKAAPAAKPVAKGKKPPKRGTFTETAEQMILGLLKTKPLTTAEINAVWKQAGRGGTADVQLGKLAKGGRIKREKLPSGQRGSMYATA